MSLAPEKMEETEGRIFNHSIVLLQGKVDHDSLHLAKQHVTNGFEMDARHDSIKLRAVTGGVYMILFSAELHRYRHYVSCTFSVGSPSGRLSMSESSQKKIYVEYWHVGGNENIDLGTNGCDRSTFQFSARKLFHE